MLGVDAGGGELIAGIDGRIAEGGEAIVGGIVVIDLRAGGVEGGEFRGDGIGDAIVEDAGDALEAGVHAGEVAALAGAVPRFRDGAVEAGLDFPFPTFVGVVHIRGAGGAVFVAERAALGDGAAAGGAVGEVAAEGEGRAGGGGGDVAAADVEVGVTIGEEGVVVVHLGAGGEDVVAGGLPIGLDTEGIAEGVFRAVLHLVLAEVGVGDGGAGADEAPGGLRAVLLVELVRGEAVDDETEGLRERGDVVEIETGEDLEGLLVAGSGGLLEDLVVLGIEAGIEAILELGRRRFEGAAADHVHGTAEAVGGLVGRGDLGDLDPGDVVDGNLFEFEGADGAAGSGAGHAGAVGGDVGEVVGEAAHGNGADVGGDVVDGDAGEIFHELADVALGDIAERVGGDDVLDVGGETLLVGRDVGGVGLAGGADGEGVEFDDVAHVFRRLVGGGLGGGEEEILQHGLAGGDGDGFGLSGEAGEEHLELGGAGRDVDEAELAGLVGERLQRGAVDGHAGVVDVLARGDVEHAALDGAGGGGLRGSESGEEKAGECEARAAEGREEFSLVHVGFWSVS